MSEIEIPDESAHLAAVEIRAVSVVPIDKWAAEAMAGAALKAAYPSLRRQVLESVVESVAAGFCSAAKVGGPVCSGCLDRARVVLGLPSEGKG